MPGVHYCEVAENIKLNDAAHAVTVRCGELARSARAGQFIHVRCSEALILRRPISICGTEGDNLRFVFEIKGKGTRRLSESGPGCKLDILGPLGNGFAVPDGNILVVGGGVGAPPLLFAAGSAKGNVTAVLGFRESGRVILRDEFEAVCGKVFITTDDGSLGVKGTVAGPVEELIKNGDFAAVLTCGPRVMMSAVARLCEKYGVPCQASLEERMGCGVGACLVCACATERDGARRMSRVCRDGPVFDAREVVWD